MRAQKDVKRQQELPHPHPANRGEWPQRKPTLPAPSSCASTLQSVRNQFPVAEAPQSVILLCQPQQPNPRPQA